MYCRFNELFMQSTMTVSFFFCFNSLIPHVAPQSFSSGFPYPGFSFAFVAKPATSLLRMGP